jgi:hypothetical protein
MADQSRQLAFGIYNIVIICPLWKLIYGYDAINTCGSVPFPAGNRAANSRKEMDHNAE